jgi:uncharacterized membrane protein YgcG
MKPPYLCLLLVLLVSWITQAAETVPLAAASVPPPSSPAKRSASDLQKLVAPIALYSDPLIAAILPASAYPLEIVQAARFVKDPNNVSKLDAQPWDDNVKAVARFPAIIQKMNDDLSWTIELGQAVVEQQKDVMDAIQIMRGKAYGAGSLRSTPQQTVTVTNIVYQQTVTPQVIYVTNTVVQVQPAQKEVIYVPQYDPTVVYAAPPPDQSDQAMKSLMTFGMGMAMGVLIGNNCDWHGGSVYVNYNYPPPPPPPPYNPPHPPPPHPPPPHPPGPPAPWQPDQNRLRAAGAPPSTAGLQSRETRGWTDAKAAQPVATRGGETPPASVDGRSAAGQRNSSERTPSAGSRESAAGASREGRSGGLRGGSSREGLFSDVGNGGRVRDFSDRGASSRGEGRSGFGGGGRGGRR